MSEDSAVSVEGNMGNVEAEAERQKRDEMQASINVSRLYTRGTIVNVSGVFLSLAGIALAELLDEPLFAVVGIGLMILLLPIYMLFRWRAGVWEEEMISKSGRKYRPVPGAVWEFGVWGMSYCQKWCLGD